MNPFSVKKKRSSPLPHGGLQASRFGYGTPAAKAEQAEIQNSLRSIGAQAKLTIGQPNDKYEQEADRIADRVMRMSNSDIARRVGAGTVQPMHIQRMCTSCSQEFDLAKREERNVDENNLCPKCRHNVVQAKELPGQSTNPQVDSGIESRINGLKGKGEPLDKATRRYFEPRFEHDFSRVRVHRDGQAGNISRSINARAFTLGNDIVFGSGQYQPQSTEGKRLLGHELTHVIQQSRMKGGAAQRELIQRTTVGDVLDNFFAPWSYEKLWVMGSWDPYTVIVRNWQPVRNLIRDAKTSIETRCAAWASNHTSSGSFTPTKTDPPVWDPRSYVRSVRSPPGTDPQTCKAHFIPYVISRGAGLIPGAPRMPSIQTVALHRCAIGSFAIGITVDSIDCAAKTATMNIWMYNAMDTGSFGRFASHPAFRFSGMERQYMWWHWTETHSWGRQRPAPRFQPKYLGGGAFLGSDGIVRQGFGAGR